MHLKARNQHIEDLSIDFSDGVLLVSLLEQVSSKRLITSKNHPKKPRFHSQKLENASIALNFLKKEGIKLVGIGPEDIVDCRIKLILGLIWTIILKWQMQPSHPLSQSSEISVKHDLLMWVHSVIPGSPPVLNLSTDWQDGKLLATLTNLICPGSVTFCDSPIDLVKQVVRVAEEQLIPALIHPEDIVSPNLDELSMMTYLSLFRDRYNLKLEQDEQDDIHYHSPNASGIFYDVVKLTLRESFDIEEFNPKQFNLKTKWTTNVEVFIKELQVHKANHKLHDVRCKVNIEDQVQRTKVVSKLSESNSFAWNQPLKFEAVNPQNIKILLYCSNKILPNEKLGRVEISKEHLLKGRTVTKQIPIESHGDLSLNITQSKTFVAPFKFSISKCGSTILIKDMANEIKFRLCEGLHFQFELYDWNGTCMFNIAVLSFPKPVVDLYRFGSSNPILSIPITGSQCYILGTSSIEWLDMFGSEIKYVRMAGDENHLCLGTVSFKRGGAVVEICPDKSFILILASLLSMIDSKAL